MGNHMNLNEIIEFVHAKRDEATNTGKGEFAKILSEVVVKLEQVTTPKSEAPQITAPKRLKPDLSQSEPKQPESE